MGVIVENDILETLHSADDQVIIARDHEGAEYITKFYQEC